MKTSKRRRATRDEGENMRRRLAALVDDLWARVDDFGALDHGSLVQVLREWLDGTLHTEQMQRRVSEMVHKAMRPGA